jgi:hypothetical protein
LEGATLKGTTMMITTMSIYFIIISAQVLLDVPSQSTCPGSAGNVAVDFDILQKHANTHSCCGSSEAAG